MRIRLDILKTDGENSVKTELYIGLSIYSCSITWSQWKETGEEEHRNFHF